MLTLLSASVNQSNNTCLVVYSEFNDSTQEMKIEDIELKVTRGSKDDFNLTNFVQDHFSKNPIFDLFLMEGEFLAVTNAFFGDGGKVINSTQC